MLYVKNPSSRLSSHRESRPANNTALYLAKIFFLLGEIGALGILNTVVYGGWAYGPGSTIDKLRNLALIFCSLFIFWSGIRKAKVVRFNRIIPLVAASIPLTSLAWSVDPSVTFTQGTAYIFAVLGAIGLAETTDGDELMHLVCLVCSLAAIASLAQPFVFPDFQAADFHGIFTQKNVLGQVMVGGVIAGLHGIRLKGRQSFRYKCAVALFIIVAFMSKSGTSIFTICTLIWIDILGRLHLRRGASRSVATALAVASIPAALYFAMNPDLILGALGKDTTLTGRTLIWPYVIEAISEKPILGWGYCAFWSELNPRSMEINLAVAGANWDVIMFPNAHNGLLEFLLELGVAGTAVFCFIWLRNFVLAMKCLGGPGRQFAVSALMVLISIVEIGVSEEVLLAAGQIWLILFFTVGLICETQLWRERGWRRRELQRRAVKSPIALTSRPR
jgi:exopolysaccharide production protein ExoQ